MNYEELNNILEKANNERRSGKYNEADFLVNNVLSELDSMSHSLQDVGSVAQIRARAFLIQAISGSQLGTYDYSIAQVQKALELAVDYNLKKILPVAFNILGSVYKSKGSYDKSLENFSKALLLYEELGEQSGVTNVIGNIGNLYSFIENYETALTYLNKALAIHTERGEKLLVARVTGNIGIVYKQLGNNDKALEYYFKALAGHEELGEKTELSGILGNIGRLYLSLDSYDMAIEYLFKSLAVSEEFGKKSGIANIMGDIGFLYSNPKFDGYDAGKAEEYLLESITLCEEIGSKHNLYVVYKYIADLYKLEKRWEEHSIHLQKYYELEKAVQSEEIRKQAEKHDNERRGAEREKSLAIERALSKATNDILANILPPTITERLLKGEKKIADNHENVSVLFIDIVGFTQLSSKLLAGELIDVLDIVFTRFDTICKKHGLEKIKTIGDAYMAVCGAPVAVENHAERTALAAIEMLEDFSMEQRFSARIDLGFRIGLHSGSVVAGIIGENKYSYDLWGDAVNTASRMESHGEAGKIHVSEEFKHAVETLHATSLQFIRRGEMEIKGKGTMKTYFLEQTI